MMEPTLGDFVCRSIELECTAPKLGNVFPEYPFEDMTHDSFLAAAKAIGNCVDSIYTRSAKKHIAAPGDAVLRSTQAMLEAAGCNTSLGTILLVIPLLESFHPGVQEPNEPCISSEKWQRLLDAEVLQKLSLQDSVAIYEAIRICSPGGLGTKKEMDIASRPPDRLLDAMAFASTYDDIALQYVTRFELCFALAQRLSALISLGKDDSILESITLLQLDLLARRPDSLIARKGGRELAEQVRVKANEVLHLRMQPSSDWREAWQHLDHWMRSFRNGEGKRIANPGTHADLIAAAILIHLLLQRTESPAPA
jgi:triphosphoribosyl-dephospho-CoA synthase